MFAINFKARVFVTPALSLVVVHLDTFGGVVVNYFRVGFSVEGMSF
jgi:hypothetical protein